ncbi:anti-anti-sigma factor [Actinoplanes lobatus]|uniref:Anti-anti-sigma factor n=1 Tax=Actinoplanes lobatus TaxID=113568 RepID=A0A7W7MK49_9ACTN|nr:anti-anti-sigma factor [Actinoplanes lobatus]
MIRPQGEIAAAHATQLRQVLVHTVRKVRPPRLVLDLTAVSRVDALNVGAVSAACALGEDHHVAVYVHNPSRHIAARLFAAGVPAQQLRQARTPA